MSRLLKKIGQGFNNHMIKTGRQKARLVLLDQSDRTLKDLGMSRELLEKGNAYWPWQSSEDQPVPVRNAKKAAHGDEATAIRTLKAFSDRELRDIGISRGSIVDSVRNGRPGIEATPASTQTLERLAQESIATASAVDINETVAVNSARRKPATSNDTIRQPVDKPSGDNDRRAAA